jgi:hypothetical protein
MKKNWFALLLFAGLAACATAPGPTQITYRGGDLTHDGTGLIVKASEEKSFIVVTNWNDHYALALPYSTEWKFIVERGSRLRGGAGNFNLTLSIEASAMSPEEQMKYVRTWATSDKNRLPPDKTELMTANGEPVLRTEINLERVDKAFKGGKHINYYSAKNWKGTLYTLHVSEVVPAENVRKFNEKKMRDYVTKGFSVEFMRK